MRRYWWVNHKQTFEHEITGGYVWAPKAKRNGHSSHFYENLRRASPGDVIVSFANTTVRYIGTVSDYALSSPKPDSFGNAGDAWADDGWMLPVIWQQLTVPFKPSSFAVDLSSMLREKYAPIQASGRGNQGAYLSEVDENIVIFILEKSLSQNQDGFLFSTSDFEPTDTGERMDALLESQIIVSGSLSETDKIQLIKARRGQGIFRTNVQSQEYACRVTGVKSNFLLIASHIKPWRSCSNSSERLDGNNGLLLTPHIDRLFDRGYITFEDDGDVILSSKIDADNIARLGISEIKFEAIPFSNEKKIYLNYHRDNVFLG